MKKNPTVSILTISYNQEDYIRYAIESIMSQKTEYDFELIIADDGSTDNTPKIIKEYAEKNPDIIKPILRKKNIGAYQNFRDALQKVSGKYLAMCEGDDYWTDPKKLQVQVDYLESHSDYALCFHPVRVIHENNEEPETVFPQRKGDFNTTSLLRENFIQTNSVMYRKQDYSELADDVMPGDWYLHLYHAQFGKIGFIDKVMSVYRKHEAGVWWDAKKNIEKLWLKYGIKQLAVFNEVLRIYGENKQHKEIIRGSIDFLLANFLDLDKKYRSSLFMRSMEIYPELVKGFSEDQLRSIRELDKQRYEHLGQIDQLRNEIAIMKASRFWKMKTAYENRKKRTNKR